ncbi:MAG: hypothetical protein IJ030_05995 [Oscillospiraceae bacterium]|nr:hypothetical protein [Oscillospiraceae bacterium]
MQEGYWVVRTYEAGAVGEKTKYFIPGSRPTGKIRLKDRRLAKKQEQNEYSAQKALARLINANFVAGDLLMGLDYSQEGMERILAWGRSHGLPVDDADEGVRMAAVWEAAAHEMEIAVRRVKRRLQKKGIALKAIMSTSDMDGETGEAVRVHHHLVVNAGVQQDFIEAWEKYGLGRVSWTPLWSNQEDRTPVAEYIIRQVRKIPDAKKYRSTRNLVRPQPKDRIALSGAEIRVPVGGQLLFRQQWTPGSPQYIRYVLPKKTSVLADGKGRDPNHLTDSSAMALRREQAPAIQE